MKFEKTLSLEQYPALCRAVWLIKNEVANDAVEYQPGYETPVIIDCDLSSPDLLRYFEGSPNYIADLQAALSDASLAACEAALTALIGLTAPLDSCGRAPFESALVGDGLGDMPAIDTPLLALCAVFNLW